MISYIFNLFIKIVPVYFIFMYIQQNYPQQYNQFLLTLSYNAIYIYSKLQIYLGKYIKQLKQVIDSYPELKNIVDKCFSLMKKLNQIEYIKDGQVISTNYLYMQHNAPQNFNFMLISYYNDNNYSNKKIVYLQKDLDNGYEISNVKFLLVEAIIGDKKYKIDLKDENYNFYIVDNILDKQFIIYYLLNYVKEDIITIEEIEKNMNENNCFVKIIDHEVNLLQLNVCDINDNIQIKKDKYIRRVSFNK